MNILITGVAGFIGSNFLKFILEKTDFNIVGIDNLQSGDKIYNRFIVPILNENKERVVFIKENINNIENINLSNIDLVFHFAATPRVLYSVEHPLESNENNVSNTLILLDWCKKNNVKRFIFSSSSSVYGNVNNFPTKEIENKNPISPYALQKKIIEEYCSMYSNLYKIDTVCLRYFNVYGENQYAENAYSTVICAWSKSFSNNNPIRLDGDGTQSRDFTNVQDVCLANYLVGINKDDFMGKCFNVGCGNNANLLEIKNIFEKISGVNPELIQNSSRAGDVYKTHADISEITKLGFNPTITLEEGIKKTYNWYKNNG